MSDINDLTRTQYSEADILPEEEAAVSPEDQELADRIELRRRQNLRAKIRRKRRMVLGMILAFILLFTMCSREIIRLQSENRALRRQHAQLEQERDRLTKELENAENKDYIKDQARKQLRLLDPGEKMFIFDDGTQEDEDKEADDGEGKADDKG